MNTPSAKLLVHVCDQTVIIKIAGRANVASSIDFKRLMDELLAKGYTLFALDLSECLLMDSTFSGVLAGFGLQLGARKNGAAGGHPIELLNPNPRIAELLENIGVIHLFKVANAIVEPDGKDKQLPMPLPADPTREEVTRNCLEAHKTLMAIDPANVPRFKDVTQFLAEDLKKLKAAK